MCEYLLALLYLMIYELIIKEAKKMEEKTVERMEREGKETSQIMFRNNNNNKN